MFKIACEIGAHYKAVEVPVFIVYAAKTTFGSIYKFLPNAVKKLFQLCFSKKIMDLCYSTYLLEPPLGCRLQELASGRQRGHCCPFGVPVHSPSGSSGYASGAHDLREQLCSSWGPLGSPLCKAVSRTWDQLAHQPQPMTHTCLKGVSCVLSGNRQHAFPL